MVHARFVGEGGAEAGGVLAPHAFGVFAQRRGRVDQAVELGRLGMRRDQRPSAQDVAAEGVEEALPGGSLGVGVNLAMLDTSELALALAGSATVASAVHAYEHTMLPRSAGIAKALDHRAEDLLSVGVPDFSDEHTSAEPR